MRQGRPGIRGSFVQVEVAHVADRRERRRVGAGEAGHRRRAGARLAHVILAAKLRPAERGGRAGALIDGWCAGLPDYTPEQVEKITGVAGGASRAPRARARRADARRWPSSAAPPLAHTNGLFTRARRQRAERAARQRRAAGRRVLHAAARSWRLRQRDRRPRRSRRRRSTSSRRACSAASSAPQVLLLDGANPVFTARRRPGRCARRSRRCRSSSASAASSTRRAPRRSDPARTTRSSSRGPRRCPSRARWSPWRAWRPPAMKPLHQTRATPDVLLDVGRRLAKPLDLPWQTFDEMLTAHVRGAAAATPTRRRVDRRAGEGRLVGHAAGRASRTPAGVAAAQTSAVRVRRAAVRRRRGAVSRSTSCRIPRPRSSTARWRTCRGCRRCPIR